MRLLFITLLLVLFITPLHAAQVEYHAWSLRGTTVYGAVCSPPIDAHLAIAQGSRPGRGQWASENFSHMVHRLGPQAAISHASGRRGIQAAITAVEVSAMGELLLRLTNGRFKAYAAGDWKTAQFHSATATFIVVSQGAAPV